MLQGQTSEEGRPWWPGEERDDARDGGWGGTACGVGGRESHEADPQCGAHAARPAMGVLFMEMERSWQVTCRVLLCWV